MKFYDICERINENFKKDGCEGIDKIIETEKAWIFTRKRKDNKIVYGEYAAVVFKDNENDAFLLMPDLQSEVGKPIKETTYSNN